MHSTRQYHNRLSGKLHYRMGLLTSLHIPVHNHWYPCSFYTTNFSRGAVHLQTMGIHKTSGMDSVSTGSSHLRSLRLCWLEPAKPKTKLKPFISLMFDYKDRLMFTFLSSFVTVSNTLSSRIRSVDLSQ